MSAQGFILIRLEETLSEDELWDLVTRCEALDGVDRASRVIGEYDLVLTVDTPGTLDQVLEQAGALRRCTVTALKISDEFVRHREMRDLKVLRDLLSSGGDRQ
ncbi:MAG: hypothetical protein ACOC8N_03190 [Spirochaetota bacterium]